MKGYKSFTFMIVGCMFFMYILAYLFLRSYSYHDTKNSTLGTIGYNEFAYLDKMDVRLYPISKADAEWIYINNSNIENYKVLTLFVPLERLELVIRGNKVVKLTDEEIKEVRHRIETIPKKIKDLPY